MNNLSSQIYSMFIFDYSDYSDYFDYFDLKSSNYCRLSFFLGLLVQKCSFSLCYPYSVELVFSGQPVLSSHPAIPCG